MARGWRMSDAARARCAESVRAAWKRRRESSPDGRFPEMARVQTEETNARRSESLRRFHRGGAAARVPGEKEA